MENQFRRNSELFGPHFCISNLKVSRTQILLHSLDFNAFCMVQENFLRFFKFVEIKEEGPNFCREAVLEKV